jgi:diacylglycerol kinase (ATP)
MRGFLLQENKKINSFIIPLQKQKIIEINQLTNKDNKFSAGKRIRSFKYAFNGIKKLLITQHNSRIHLFVAILVVIAGFLLNISKTEWLFVLFAIGFVFAAELFNSALESVVDLVSPEYQKKAGDAKDFAAGAVLIAAIASAVAGLIIFTPKLIGLLIN